MSGSANSIYEIIRGKLARAGYKLTPQREATLQVMIGNNADLLTAEEVFIEVKKENPSIGLATVYRTLDILSELEIIEKISFHDGMSRYELVKEDKTPHNYYLLCLDCGQVKDVNEPAIKEIENYIQKENTFKITTHHLTFHGICQNCLEKKRLKNE